MIGRIHGKLLEKHPPQIVVDVQGVGYELDVPMSTFYQLPATGAEVTLYTHLAVREDAHQLYGFGTEHERRAFRQLLKISGIGRKTAERLLLELRDKLDAVAGTPAAAKGDGQAGDVTNALLALGYNDREAGWALKQLPAGLNVADGIRQALRLLSKS